MVRISFLCAVTLSILACSSNEDQVTKQSLQSDASQMENAAPEALAAAYDPVGLPGMAQIADKGVVLQNAVWSNPVIAVCWENPFPANQVERAWVQDAVAQSWGNGPRVRFFGWQNRCAANSTGIRIKIDEDGPHTKGLGNQINGVRDGMVLTSHSPAGARVALRRRKDEKVVSVQSRPMNLATR